jgi:uncharacterized phage infection (PIP) family protein YhgE
MSNEEFEKKMEFIVGQQAQFAVDIQQLRESQAQLQATQAQTEQVVARLATVTLEGFKDVNAKINALVDSQIRLTEAQSRTDESLKYVNTKIDALVDSQIKLTEAQSHLTESQSRLAESQSLTDEKLRNLIIAVDRYFSEGRNGKPEG